MPEKAKKILSNVHPDFSFKLKDGGELRNLEEMMHALKKMERDIFLHHVTAERNDFARWVKDVLHDDELAAELGYCTDKENMEEIVRCRILELHAKIQKHEDFKSFEGLLPPQDEYYGLEKEDHKDRDEHKEGEEKHTHNLQANPHKDGEEEEENLGWKGNTKTINAALDRELEKEKTKEADSVEEADKLFGFNVAGGSKLKMHWFILGMIAGFMIGVLIGLWLG